VTIYIQASESEVTMRSFERKDEEGRRTTQYKKQTAEPARGIAWAITGSRRQEDQTKTDESIANQGCS
jgi:hypothetical protein